MRQQLQPARATVAPIRQESNWDRAELITPAMRRARSFLQTWKQHGYISPDRPLKSMDLYALAKGLIGTGGYGGKPEGPTPSLAENGAWKEERNREVRQLASALRMLSRPEVECLDVYWSSDYNRVIGDDKAAAIMGINRHAANSLRAAAEGSLGTHLIYGA